jgi:hypothetical protein
LAENQSCAPHADFPIICGWRRKPSNVSEFDTCENEGEPGFVPDHGFGSTGVGHHVCDCEQSIRLDIWDKPDAISGAGAVSEMVVVAVRDWVEEQNPWVDTGGKWVFTQQVHCEFFVVSDTICPVVTQQVSGGFFHNFDPNVPTLDPEPLSKSSFKKCPLI